MILIICFLIFFILAFNLRGFSVARLTSFHLSCLLLIICYSVVPLVLVYGDIPSYYYKGWMRRLSQNVYDDDKVAVALFLVALCVLLFSLGYRLVSFRRKEVRPISPKQQVALLYCGIVLLVVGVLSFLIYLQSLGSIVGGYLANNRMLFEEDKVDVSSSVSFLKNFSSLIVYATFILWGLKVKKEKSRLVGFLYHLGLVASVFYLFYTAGRMALILFFATIFISSMALSRRVSILKVCVLTTVAGATMLFGKSLFRVMIYEDALERSLERMSEGSTIVVALYDFIGEFSFPLSSFLAALEKNSEWLLFKDLVFGFTYMLPARLTIPIENTSLQNTKNVLGDHVVTTGIPSDIFSYGYLNLGVLGLFIVPLVFGVVCRWLDSFKRCGDNNVANVFILSCTFVVGFRVMYFDPKHLLKGNFALIVTLLLVFMVLKFTKDRHRYKKAR